MKAYEIVGGYAHICNCCEKDDGRPTDYWSDKDFDLCFECIKRLGKEFKKRNECSSPDRRKRIIRKL